MRSHTTQGRFCVAKGKVRESIKRSDLAQAQIATGSRLLKCKSESGGDIMAFYYPSQSYNEYLLTATMEFWIAMTFPAIYMAKNL
jgi:hypothetical protein